MPRKAKSATSPARSKKALSKASLGDLVVRGLNEGISHARGETVLPTRTVYIPETVDVHAIRERTGLSQSRFADRYGFSLRTLQEWEQGRARPDNAVRAYLLVIDRDRTAVEKALTVS